MNFSITSQEQVAFRNFEELLLNLIKNCKKDSKLPNVSVSTLSSHFSGILSLVGSREGAEKYISLYDSKNDQLHFLSLSSITAVTVHAPLGVFDALTGGKFPPNIEAPSPLELKRYLAALEKELGEKKITLAIDESQNGSRYNVKLFANCLASYYKEAQAQADFKEAWKNIIEIKMTSNTEAGWRISKNSNILEVQVSDSFKIDIDIKALEKELLSLL